MRGRTECGGSWDCAWRSGLLAQVEQANRRLGATDLSVFRARSSTLAAGAKARLQAAVSTTSKSSLAIEPESSRRSISAQTSTARCSEHVFFRVFRSPGGRGQLWRTQGFADLDEFTGEVTEAVVLGDLERGCGRGRGQEWSGWSCCRGCRRERAGGRGHGPGCQCRSRTIP